MRKFEIIDIGLQTCKLVVGDENSWKAKEKKKIK
jgi:hypothetical protein